MARTETITSQVEEDLILWMGPGSDELNGEIDRDSLYGGTENDALYGGLGNDILDGGLGDDRLYGGPCNDTLRAAQVEIILDAVQDLIG